MNQLKNNVVYLSIAERIIEESAWNMAQAIDQLQKDNDFDRFVNYIKEVGGKQMSSSKFSIPMTATMNRILTDLELLSKTNNIYKSTKGKIYSYLHRTGVYIGVRKC